jgi:hypothetical protein
MDSNQRNKPVSAYGDREAPLELFHDGYRFVRDKIQPDSEIPSTYYRCSFYFFDISTFSTLFRHVLIFTD